MVALINHFLAAGKSPQAPDWPVDLERWRGTESVTGVARGQDLEIVGAAILPIIFKGLDGRTATQHMRFKIFGKGCCGWMGLIMGGPSLEDAPLGLGLRTHSGGHHIAALGLTVRRCEEAEVSERLDMVYSLSPSQVARLRCQPLGLGTLRPACGQMIPTVTRTMKRTSLQDG